METEGKYIFSVIDYLVFIALLLVSACVGLYYRFFKKERSTNDFFLGGRQMSLWPVTFSIIASFMSAISILGTVSEVYQFGIQYFVLGLSYFVAFPLAAEIFMPMFYRLKITSVHQYLELRFSQSVRTIASAVFIIQMILYMSIVLYAPSLAFNQVSQLPMWLSIVLTGLVCTFYTTLGGMKAVMWTDLIQMIVVYCGFLATVIMGTLEQGGFKSVWQSATDGGRMNLFNFDPNPLIRHSFWTLFIGGSFMCATIYCTNQAQLQRYLSCKNERTARIAIWLNIPFTLFFLIILCFGGLVAYAVFSNCDPRIQGIISKSDQIMPYLVVKLFHNLPGFSGLFVSCIFSAALSTISTGINSLAAVLLEDIISPIVFCARGYALRDTSGERLARIIAIMLGMLTIGLAFLCALLPSTVLQLALSLFGMAGGPILAVFCLGFFCPWINRIGALVGLLCALIVTFYLGFGAVLDPAAVTTLSLGSNCSTLRNSTGNFLSLTVTNATSTIIRWKPHHLSYLYYAPISIIVALLAGSLVSLFFGKGEPLHAMYLHPIVLACSKRHRLLAQQQKEAKGLSNDKSCLLLENAENSQRKNRNSVANFIEKSQPSTLNKWNNAAKVDVSNSNATIETFH